MNGASAEDLYWISETYYRGVHSDELRSLCCCLLVSAGSLLWQARLPALYVGPRLAVPVLLLCAGILQRYWFCRSPTTFLKHRRTIRLVNRIVRSVGLIFTPIAARAALRGPSLAAPAPGAPATTTSAPVPASAANTTSFLDPYPYPSAGALQLPRIPFALKQLMMLSGATMLMAHSLHTTLPPAPQALLHAASTLGLLAYHSAPIAAMFYATPYAADLRSTCQGLNFVLSLAQVDLQHAAGITQSYDHSCEQHAEQLLAMFVIVYFGFVLPVYLAVRIERHRYRQFQLELWLSHAADMYAADAVADESTACPRGPRPEASDSGNRGCAGQQAGGAVGATGGSSGAPAAGGARGGEVAGREGVPAEVERGWALLHDAEEDSSRLCLYDVAMATGLALMTWGVLVHCREWLMVLVVPV